MSLEMTTPALLSHGHAGGQKGGEHGDGQDHSSAYPHCTLTPINTGMQYSRFFISDGFISLINVKNPSMSNEDDLQEIFGMP